MATYLQGVADKMAAVAGNADTPLVVATGVDMNSWLVALPTETAPTYFDSVEMLPSAIAYVAEAFAHEGDAAVVSEDAGVASADAQMVLASEIAAAVALAADAVADAQMECGAAWLVDCRMLAAQTKYSTATGVKHLLRLRLLVVAILSVDARAA